VSLDVRVKVKAVLNGRAVTLFTLSDGELDPSHEFEMTSDEVPDTDQVNVAGLVVVPDRTKL
jgi:hypothetical protein